VQGGVVRRCLPVESFNMHILIISSAIIIRQRRAPLCLPPHAGAGAYRTDDSAFLPSGKWFAQKRRRRRGGGPFSNNRAEFGKFLWKPWVLKC
jgi:hypothetical protein